MPVLTLTRGAEQTRHQLDRADILVGAEPEADVTIPDADGPWLFVFRSPSGWRWRALGLVPVTAVKIHKGVDSLHHGDILDVGGYKLLFEDPASAAREQPAAPAAGGPRPPPMPLEQPGSDGALALVGTPLGKDFEGQAGDAVAFRPHLEVHPGGDKPAITIQLGREPILFGSDKGCHVKVTGLRVPDFLATVETLGRKVTARRVAPPALLGPEVTLDGEPLKEDVELRDGQRLFLGDVTVFVRLNKR